jgi:hypothetical protein
MLGPALVAKEISVRKKSNQQTSWPHLTADRATSTINHAIRPQGREDFPCPGIGGDGRTRHENSEDWFVFALKLPQMRIRASGRRFDQLEIHRGHNVIQQNDYAQIAATLFNRKASSGWIFETSPTSCEACVLRVSACACLLY